MVDIAQPSVVVSPLSVVIRPNSPNDLSVNLTHGDLMTPVPQQKGRSCPVAPSVALADLSKTNVSAFASSRSLRKPQSPTSRMSVIVIGDISHVVIDVRLVVEH